MGSGKGVCAVVAVEGDAGVEAGAGTIGGAGVDGAGGAEPGAAISSALRRLMRRKMDCPVGERKAGWGR